ncbi:hypothetical protein AMATHDRAFT_163532 [Amanita thiersii Skay4041]|uniref:CCHC-type domain-containing protein n=1 Tax=Amanita thiersii Skay4041 TaxID=703135 RepID=A0A2A9NBC0_9AGAR|nr:hypothetical protein AMATHDRAFT_163532 [Amanita thiersii Skay4041]
MAVPELLSTLEKWYELVIRLDRQWRQAVAERKTFAARGAPQPQWRPPVQQTQRDPNAMQVDRNRGPIRCYNCRQTGHMARACPNPRQTQTRLVNAWNSGTNEERDELWRLMMGGSDQTGGGMARIEEIPDTQPAPAQTAQTAPCTQGFTFGQ